MPIAKRRLKRDTYTKVEKFLKQAGQPMQKTDSPTKHDAYCYTIEIKGGADDGLILDALLILKNDKIIIKTIWVMELDHTKGKVAARNMNGETGRQAEIFGEKYFNRFFEHLETVDVENFDEYQFTVTAELIKELEGKIDESIDPTNITESDISAYNRIEFIVVGEQILRNFLHKLDENNFVVTFVENLQEFEVMTDSLNYKFGIPLSSIITHKFEIRKCFGETIVKLLADGMCSVLREE